jgi:hypothetical protein
MRSTVWYGAVTPKTPATRMAFAWYVTGVLVSSTVAALKLRTLDPLRSARAGLRALRTDFAGSSFLSAAAHGSTRARAARCLRGADYRDFSVTSS